MRVADDGSEDDHEPDGCDGASPCRLRTSLASSSCLSRSICAWSSLSRAISSADRMNNGLDLGGAGFA